MNRLVIAVVLLCVSLSAHAFGPYVAQVNRVIDGDTVDVTVQLWPGLSQRVSVRLAGVDTPELKAVARGDTPELKAAAQCERDLAQQARTFVVDALLKATVVRITEIKPDKFAGRVDAFVFLDGASLGDSLVLAGFARPYDGGKRAPWCI